MKFISSVINYSLSWKTILFSNNMYLFILWNGVVFPSLICEFGVKKKFLETVIKHNLIMKIQKKDDKNWLLQLK